MNTSHKTLYQLQSQRIWQLYTFSWKVRQFSRCGPEKVPQVFVTAQNDAKYYSSPQPSKFLLTCETKYF